MPRISMTATGGRQQECRKHLILIPVTEYSTKTRPKDLRKTWQRSSHSWRGLNRKGCFLSKCERDISDMKYLRPLPLLTPQQSIHQKFRTSYLSLNKEHALAAVPIISAHGLGRRRTRNKLHTHTSFVIKTGNNLNLNLHSQMVEKSEVT